MAMFTTYAKTGPFAWSGLFPWWIPVVDYTLWSVLMSWGHTPRVTRCHRRRWPAPDQARASSAFWLGVLP
jgi:hypothetical protein